MGRAGSGRPTIADVAARAGVSVGAVSAAVNGKGRLSEATRLRVLAAAAELGWAPSAAAVALRGARVGALGLVLRRDPDLLSSDPHFAQLITGVESALAPLGWGLLLHLVDDGGEERAYRALAAGRRVDGVVLTESRVRDPRFALLRELGLPAALVGTPWRPDPVPTVRARDQHRGITRAVEHLVGLGHRRFGHVSGPEDRVHTRRRRAALRRALGAHGLVPVCVRASGFDPGAAAVAARELLTSAERPTAVLFANDSMAAAGLVTARRLGIDVPGELSVVGHDDLPLCELLHPALTTVRQDLVGLGRAAAVTLLAGLGVVDGAGLEEVRPPELVVRESTGPAPR
ncbi:LacI family DNA-binding transcriptional regulator [Actinosynnema pretiosum subsp. pretiosum]|uniref:LacI family DNA-binding transcriptional regulator n=1 Tax=Actinosynnema pretiosum subsp. pretiosum TaxID=103721 RepID=A0AA45L6M0_9PSEU|nr:Maltose operon transcriptional repressor MalR, LacI family [Actinosynnema pretiosum subsp. pretiosum]QUF04484.1 LacI family DNA-binding transcriptional regulator [Actinosynnema pretiosum subsp. pretiosum]